jgi:hypothetical protein
LAYATVNPTNIPRLSSKGIDFMQNPDMNHLFSTAAVLLVFTTKILLVDMSNIYIYILLVGVVVVVYFHLLFNKILVLIIKLMFGLEVLKVLFEKIAISKCNE